MSGGRFNYLDSTLKTEIFGYNFDKPKNVFEDLEVSELVWDVLDLVHTFDWYISGDTDEDDYLSAKKNFKNKWLENGTQRQKQIIDDAINELRDELYKTYEVKDIENQGVKKDERDKRIQQ